MRTTKLFFFLAILSFILLACSKSKPTQIYVLNPLSVGEKSGTSVRGLKIGVDDLSIPTYLSKVQIPLFYTPNQASLYESHEWAEDLQKNTKRVIATNLSLLLPGTVVETSPWDIKFKPDYTVQVTINQWAVTVKGQSQLQANYVIFNETAPVYQKNITYYQHITQVVPENLVVSMNSNLTRLTRDIAHSIRLLARH